MGVYIVIACLVLSLNSGITRELNCGVSVVTAELESFFSDSRLIEVEYSGTAIVTFFMD